MKTLRKPSMTILSCVRRWDSSVRGPHLVAPVVDFLDDQGAIFITTEWAVEWATNPSYPPAGWQRLRWVRDLHATTAHRPVLRSRRRRYYRTVLSVTRLISTAMPRLLSLLRPPAVYPPLRAARRHLHCSFRSARGHRHAHQ